MDAFIWSACCLLIFFFAGAGAGTLRIGKFRFLDLPSALPFSVLFFFGLRLHSRAPGGAEPYLARAFIPYLLLLLPMVWTLHCKSKFSGLTADRVYVLRHTNIIAVA